MTFLDAAKAVLKATKRPLTSSEITELAINRGLITTMGRTPTLTMNAALYRTVKNEPGGSIRIRREYEPGAVKAIRGSVRWVWNRR